MVFWAGMLVGAGFAWLAIKRGFYESWALAFNIIISVYLAVFLGPIIADIVPVAGGTAYNTALCMMAAATVSFLVLQGISYTFVTGQFKVPFPRIFDVLGTAFLGFLTGFLIWSFVGLLICITPVPQQSIAKQVGMNSQFEQANVSVVCWWCDLVHTVVSRRGSNVTSEQIISGLLESAEPKRRGTQAGSAEPTEHDDTKTGTIEPRQLGPAPHRGAGLSPPPEAGP